MPTLSAGSSADPGPYSCTSCGSTIAHGGQSLPTCENCGGATWKTSGGEHQDDTQKPVGSI